MKGVLRYVKWIPEGEEEQKVSGMFAEAAEVLKTIIRTSVVNPTIAASKFRAVAVFLYSVTQRCNCVGSFGEHGGGPWQDSSITEAIHWCCVVASNNQSFPVPNPQVATLFQRYLTLLERITCDEENVEMGDVVGAWQFSMRAQKLLLGRNL